MKERLQPRALASWSNEELAAEAAPARASMSMPQLPAIRRATPDDADTVSALATRTFVETFGHLYPAEDLQAFLANAYAVDKRSEESRVGKECVSTWRSRWSTSN